MATCGKFSSYTCSICTANFNTKCLPCRHTICLKCLHQLVSYSSEEGQYSCPVCGHEVSSPKEEVVGFPTSITKARPEKKLSRGGVFCLVCNQRASHICLECGMPLCEKCEKRHNIPRVRFHHLIELNDSKQREISLPEVKFCEDRGDKICSEEIHLLKDEADETNDVFDVNAEARKNLEKTKVKLLKYQRKIDEAYDSVTRMNKTLPKQTKKAKAEINNFADSFLHSLRNIINRSRKQVLERVTDEEKKQKNTFSDELNTLSQKKHTLQDVIYINDALKESDDNDVIDADNEMKQNLTEIEKELSIGSASNSDLVYIPPKPAAIPGELEDVRCAVNDVMIKAFPESEKTVSLNVVNIIKCFWIVRSICFTKSQNVLIVQGFNPYLSLFDESSEPVWKLKVTMDELKREGVHGVIEKHNEENPDDKIPTDDYTDLKKPFPYMDTNDVGDKCSVIDDYNIVAIKPVNGVVRTLTFNPFAKAGQEFKPADVCWSGNKEVYILDLGADAIILYSLQDGFQKSFKTPSEHSLSSIAMDGEGKLWIGDKEGCIHICDVD